MISHLASFDIGDRRRKLLEGIVLAHRVSWLLLLGLRDASSIHVGLVRWGLFVNYIRRKLLLRRGDTCSNRAICCGRALVAGHNLKLVVSFVVKEVVDLARGLQRVKLDSRLLGLVLVLGVIDAILRQKLVQLLHDLTVGGPGDFAEDYDFTLLHLLWHDDFTATERLRRRCHSSLGLRVNRRGWYLAVRRAQTVATAFHGARIPITSAPIVFISSPNCRLQF